MSKIFPVILCGGEGMRLWPMSRREYPKQFLPLAGDVSLLQGTIERLDSAALETPIALCHQDQRFLVAEQLRAADQEAITVVAEPHGRGTAAAAVIAALMVADTDPGAVVLLMPSDHDISDRAAFNRAMTQAAGIVADGGIATLGITPTRAETGYGYIRRGGPLNGSPDGYKVADFFEKPDQQTAESYVSSGEYYWNSGIFAYAAGFFLAEARRCAPEIVAACEKALESRIDEGAIVRFDPDRYLAIPKDSIDYAVMEKTEDAYVIATDMGWSDVGAWSALWQRAEKDRNGNALIGDTIAVGTHNCYLRSEDKMVAAVGIRDLIVVSTKDAVMVATQDKSQDVRLLVDALNGRGRTEATTPPRVHRPWGCYEGLGMSDRYQVKILEVKPGAKLSYQMHHRRNEHWIVVQGTARVTLDDETFLVETNQSTYIPVGAKHRVENPGDIPLQIIEIQTGDYFGEDDIVRFEDVYGRVAS